MKSFDEPHVGELKASELFKNDELPSVVEEKSPKQKGKTVRDSSKLDGTGSPTSDRFS
jgi:hypothetical protein